MKSYFPIVVPMPVKILKNYQEISKIFHVIFNEIHEYLHPGEHFSKSLRHFLRLSFLNFMTNFEKSK